MCAAPVSNTPGPPKAAHLRAARQLLWAASNMGVPPQTYNVLASPEIFRAGPVLAFAAAGQALAAPTPDAAALEGGLLCAAPAPFASRQVTILGRPRARAGFL